jgi:hypothetical protein
MQKLFPRLFASENNFWGIPALLLWSGFSVISNSPRGAWEIGVLTKFG